MDQWLVRTANNSIVGPYSRDQVVQLIRDGKLGPQDEVCQANHYWITLHEHEEVQRFLGVQIPRMPRGEDDEITETQTEAHSLRSEPVSHPIEVDLPPMPEIPADYDGSTAVLSREGLRGPQRISAAIATPAATSKAAAPVFAPKAIPGLNQGSMVRGSSVAGQLERSSIWRGFAWILIVAACLIVYMVLKLLHARPSAS